MTKKHNNKPLTMIMNNELLENEYGKSYLGYGD